MRKKRNTMGKKRNNVQNDAIKVKGKKFQKFTKIWAAIYLIALVVFEIVLVEMDMLPAKILAEIIIIMTFLSIILFVQLFFQNVKKWAKVFAVILSSLLILLYGFGTAYAMGTMSFLDGITTDASEDAVEVTEHPFTILFSGMDTSGDIDKEARSDVNMLVTVNPTTHKILITSIPRDYYVILDNGMGDKLTHAGLYGIDESEYAIENLLGIKINYYVKVNYSTVTELVDAMGGLDIVSDFDFYTVKGNYHIEKGENHLSGAETLSFARERKAFIDGDNQRIKDQAIVMEAIIDKLTSSTTLISKYNSLLNAIEPYMKTDLTATEIKALVKMQISDNPEWKITQNSLTGFDSTQTTYSTGATEVYVMTPDQSSVDEATAKINKVLGISDESSDDNSSDNSDN